MAAAATAGPAGSRGHFSGHSRSLAFFNARTSSGEAACALDAELWAAGPAAQVVFVSSGGQYTERLEVEDFEFEKPRKFDGTQQYARDKRRQVRGVRLAPSAGRVGVMRRVGPCPVHYSTSGARHPYWLWLDCMEGEGSLSKAHARTSHACPRLRWLSGLRSGGGAPEWSVTACTQVQATAWGWLTAGGWLVLLGLKS